MFLSIENPQTPNHQQLWAEQWKMTEWLFIVWDAEAPFIVGEFPWTHFISEVNIRVVQDDSPEVFSNVQATYILFYPTTSQQEQSHSVRKACAGVWGSAALCLLLVGWALGGIPGHH